MRPLVQLMATNSASRIKCFDPSGNAKDWWSMFKCPSDSGAPAAHPTWKNGTGFWYYDGSNAKIQEGAGANVGSQNFKNPLYGILHELYPFSPASGLGYVMVNDQLPDGTTDSNRAHAKGVFVFDKNGGVYLEHSTPRFPFDPKLESEYRFASSTTNGQSFMCVSLDFPNMELLAQALLVARPRAYASYVPTWAASKVPSLAKLATNAEQPPDLTKSVEIRAGSTKFTYLAKSKKWGKDLFKDYIAPYFKQSFYVSTWQNGAAVNYPSDCSGSYSVYNVQRSTYGENSWSRTKDHSKWAAGNTAVCVSGINRQLSQADRGGGALCKGDSAFGAAMKPVYSSPTSDVQKC